MDAFYTVNRCLWPVSPFDNQLPHRYFPSFSLYFVIHSILSEIVSGAALWLFTAGKEILKT